MVLKKCIKCERNVKFVDGLTPITPTPDPETVKKMRYGEIFGDAIAAVEIYRRVGGCVELAGSKWYGFLCEKCMAELIEKKSLKKDLGRNKYG
jgi:hypothetical protein